MDAATTTPSIVFSFQGAFGPPTYGHYMSMKNFAQKISHDYPDNQVKMLFMPGGNSSDKKHLYPTQQDRKAVLDLFCEMLKRDFPDPSLVFETSEIEYDIVNQGVITENVESKPKSNPSTIVTIEKLTEKYPGAEILIGMGLDNMFELPFWTSIDEYASKCKKIYVVDRVLSVEESEMVKPCNITNESSGGGGGGAAAKVQIKIKASIPTWWNTKDDKKVTEAMANKLGLGLDSTIETRVSLDGSMKGAKEFNYNGKLPEIVIITPPEGMTIPGTSSTLLRKLIASFNEGDPARKDELKQMIQTMMFGLTPPPELDYTGVLEQTISGYLRESLYKPESKLCDDIQKILKQATGNDFAAYKRLFPGVGGGVGVGDVGLGGGGYRPNTRKNKKKSTKRILRKIKKMKSRNLRMKKKRSRSRK
jgi:nicotinic acid mononucleotide adenylyltransferase